MRRMKLKYFFLCLCLLSCMFLYAQDIDDTRNLRILYIDHEPSLLSSKLIRYMRQMRREQIEFGHALIIYMPNGENPYISLTGIKDKSGQGLDTPAAFDRICEALNQASHEKTPWYDRQKIVGLFDEYNILNSENKITYGNVRLEFYLTPEFWQMGYNESIIAPIYFALNVPELLKQNFYFDIYVDPDNIPKYEKTAPFGLYNFEDINRKLSIDEYTF